MLVVSLQLPDLLDHGIDVCQKTIIIINNYHSGFFYSISLHLIYLWEDGRDSSAPLLHPHVDIRVSQEKYDDKNNLEDYQNQDGCKHRPGYHLGTSNSAPMYIYSGTQFYDTKVSPLHIKQALKTFQWHGRPKIYFRFLFLFYFLFFIFIIIFNYYYYLIIIIIIIIILFYFIFLFIFLFLFIYFFTLCGILCLVQFLPAYQPNDSTNLIKLLMEPT